MHQVTDAPLSLTAKYLHVFCEAEPKMCADPRRPAFRYHGTHSIRLSVQNSVKNMANSNMYSISADEIRGLFGDYVEGSENGAVVALSAEPLPHDARNALEKTLDAFGYGGDALAYATLVQRNASAKGDDSPISDSLDSHALFLLIEGLDPICLIVCDWKAATTVEAAYRTACGRDTAQHVFGRPCVIFNDLSALLASDQGKQRAWSLLKTLPRISR